MRCHGVWTEVVRGAKSYADGVDGCRRTGRWSWAAGWSWQCAVPRCTRLLGTSAQRQLQQLQQYDHHYDDTLSIFPTIVNIAVFYRPPLISALVLNKTFRDFAFHASWNDIVYVCKKLMTAIAYDTRPIAPLCTMLCWTQFWVLCVVSTVNREQPWISA